MTSVLNLQPVPFLKLLVSLAAVLGLAACGGGSAAEDAESPALSYVIEIDGSATVLGITETAAEEYTEDNPDAHFVLQGLGTTQGFEKFLSSEVDVIGASRRITEEESQLADENGIEYVELIVAMDGIAVVAHRDNRVISCLTVEELKKIWRPGSLLYQWNDIRPQWPEIPLNLYGPRIGSGTSDYLTGEIVGEVKASRYDYTYDGTQKSLADRISKDTNSLGYLSYGFYLELKHLLRLVAVDAGEGCVSPTYATIADGRYSPLSRPLYLYASEKGMARQEYRAFLKFYMENGYDFAARSGYSPLAHEEYRDNLVKLE